MTTDCSLKSRLTNVLTRPFVLWGLAAGATALLVQWILNHEALHSPAKPMLALLPSLMAALCVVAFVKDVRKLDEMVRRIHLQAATISFMLTVILSFVFDGLKDAGIYRATLSDLNSATVLIWAVALIFLSVRYR